MAKRAYVDEHGKPPWVCYVCGDLIENEPGDLHHIDEDRSNNTAENLRAMHHTCHARFHADQRRGAVSAFFRGRKQSEEHIAKRSASLRGKAHPQSSESKEAIREGLRRAYALGGRGDGRITYFAYGSNLCLSGMGTRAPAAIKKSTAVLHNWKLVFRGVADIVPETDAKVHGGVWRITPECLLALNRYEGFPHYYQQCLVEVEIPYRGSTRKILALTYVMTKDSGGLRPPGDYYFGIVERGFEAWGLDTGPLYEALEEAYEHCYKKGAVAFVRDGKKRLKPIYESDLKEMEVILDDADLHDVDECLCKHPGVSPATVADIKLDCVLCNGGGA